jgi:hypothetical protein
VARWFRLGLAVAAPFVLRCIKSSTMLRFHIPLIKPDLRFSRIRLSDKDSRFRPRKVTCLGTQLNKVQLFVQVGVRKP